MMNEVQREISIIAYINWNKFGGSMSYTKLREELNARGLHSNPNNRGLGRQIATAYDRAIQEKNQGIADCIANYFTNDAGKRLKR